MAIRALAVRIALRTAEKAAAKFAEREAAEALEKQAAKTAEKKAAEEATPKDSGRPSGGDEVPCNSFVPGTRILLANGKTKTIEDVKVGDKVLATDAKTGKTKALPVMAAFGGTNYKNLV